MTRRILLAALASLILLAGVHRHQPSHTPEACAKRLHIAYTPQDGATERLTAFGRCVDGAR